MENEFLSRSYQTGSQSHLHKVICEHLKMLTSKINKTIELLQKLQNHI